MDTSDSSRPQLCLITCPDPESARRIATTLVEERLAACVNAVPGLSSTYRWQGAVEQASEVLLLVKTVAARVQALQARVTQLHPYELPEFVVLEIAGGSAAYLDWVAGNSRPADPG